MTRSAQQTAQELADALTEARTVYTAQREHAASAQQRADATHLKLFSTLNAYRSDPAGANAQQQWGAGTLSAQDIQARMTEMSALNLRWEQALSNSHLALMRLYAFADAQESCGRIAQTLQTLRLLQLERPLESRPNVPMPRLDAEDIPEEDPKGRKIAITLDFMQNMESYTEEVRKSYEDKSVRTLELLNQLCDDAQTLKQRLSA